MTDQTKINVCPHCNYEHDIAKILAAAQNKTTQARCNKCDGVFNVSKVSDEERFFALWLVEAEEYGLIESWEYQPASYPLIERKAVIVEEQFKTKVNLVEKVMFGKHVYTADYAVKPTDAGLIALSGIFIKTFLTDFYDIIIDTKGGYANNASNQEFSINRKLMYSRYGVYVERVIPWKPQRDIKGVPKKKNKDGSMKPVKCFFMDTFCPKALRTLRNGDVSAKGKDCPTIDEFINKLK